jgi:hypothetical protein
MPSLFHNTVCLPRPQAKGDNQYYERGMASHNREIINPKIIPCHSSVINIY